MARNLEENPQQRERRELISKCVTELCDGLGLRVEDSRIVFYAKALDDLTTVQLNHGFDIARRNLGAFLPDPKQLREWCEGWRPAGYEEQLKPLAKSDLVAAGIKLKVSKQQIDEWLEAAKESQQEYYAKLAEDPKWQALYEQHGRPGLTPKPTRQWESEDAKRQWASDTAEQQGWRR